MGWLSDIERQGYEFVAMMKEAEEEVYDFVSYVHGELQKLVFGNADKT